MKQLFCAYGPGFRIDSLSRPHQDAIRDCHRLIDRLIEHECVAIQNKTYRPTATAIPWLLARHTAIVSIDYESHRAGIRAQSSYRAVHGTIVHDDYLVGNGSRLLVHRSQTPPSRSQVFQFTTIIETSSDGMLIDTRGENKYAFPRASPTGHRIVFVAQLLCCRRLTRAGQCSFLRGGIAERPSRHVRRAPAASPRVAASGVALPGKETT